jgi:hypothetical protein
MMEMGGDEDVERAMTAGIIYYSAACHKEQRI